MGPVNKLRHYWNRLRLLLNSDYYTQYLKNQGMKIGRNSRIIYPSYIDARFPYLLEIGDDVTISRNVTILTHDAATAWAGDMVKIARVVIKNHTFIGANSTILCGTAIGTDVIIGAGSVVSGKIPPNSVYAGNPAKYICDTSAFIDRYREKGKTSHFIESSHYRHPYISRENKNKLLEILEHGPGYICSTLPDRHQEK